jgi:hypothetical protein
MRPSKSFGEWPARGSGCTTKIKDSSGFNDHWLESSKQTVACHGVNEIEILELFGGSIEAATHVVTAKSGKLCCRIHRSTLPALSTYRANSQRAPE